MKLVLRREEQAGSGVEGLGIEHVEKLTVSKSSWRYDDRSFLVQSQPADSESTRSHPNE